MPTPVPVLGSIGARVDLALRAGDTLGPFTVTLSDPVTGGAVNLFGATLEGLISKDKNVAADIAMVVTVTDAVAGKFTIVLTATGSLDGGSNFFQAVSNYTWRLNYADSAGTKQTLLYGILSVAPGVLP